jgi:S-methylmethionine-dependent homocysteine/selenocysteine methylase
MLTDGGIETRLIYQDHLTLPDFASFLPLFDPAGRVAIEAPYRSYFNIAADAGLPMQVGAPTWRAHPEGPVRQGFTASDGLHRVNAAGVALLSSPTAWLPRPQRIMPDLPASNAHAQDNAKDNTRKAS